MIGYYEEYEKRKYQILCKQFTSSGCPLHFHGEMELSYIISETHTVTINNSTLDLEKGDMYFCNPYEPHTCRSNKNGEHILLTIRPFEYMPFKNKIEYRMPNFLTDKEFNTESHALLKSTMNRQPHINDIEKQGYICLILGKIIEHYDYNKEKIKNGNLDEILIYINGNYKANLTRETLAEKFGYSPTYLSHLFKQHFNCGIMQYINNLRYEKVIENFSRANSNKTEIILDSGFNNIQSFYRINRIRKNKLDKIVRYHEYDN
ncbi:MAG: helix-turn-helix domain-containing protein [Clostridia bacterium]|nr:helix-turn-helix domain-containing protein [Clostridia bacterium]